MTQKIFVTAEGEELTLEDTLIRAMRSVTALNAIVKEQDILLDKLADRLNVLENTVLDRK